MHTGLVTRLPGLIHLKELPAAHVVEFAGIEFRGLTRALLLETTDHLKVITTVNAELIVLANRDPRFAKLLCDSYSTFDGQLPYLLARFTKPKASIEKISGSDFLHDLCAWAGRSGARVFLLGARPKVNQRACEVLRNRYRVEIDGISPPFAKYPFPTAIDREIGTRVAAFKPDILFVAFGAPKQEFWIADHHDFLQSLGVRWAMAVGGSLDYVAGREKRAPRMVQHAGFEWLWRLIQKPRERFRRTLRFFLMFRYLGILSIRVSGKRHQVTGEG